MPVTKRTQAYLLLLGNALLWGLAMPIVKLGFTHGLTPVSFLLSRFFFAAILSLPIGILAFKKNPPTFKQILTIIVLELLGSVLSLTLLYIGLNQTTSIEASLIAVTYPIFVTLGGIIFLKENQEKHESIGLTLAIIGTVILVIRPLLTKGLNGQLTGNLFILGQNIVLSAYLILAKKLYQNLNKWLITHLSFWISFLSFSTFVILQGNSPFTIISSLFTTQWPLIATLYMAVFGSIIGLTLYLAGQNKIEASEASVFTYLQPIVSLPAAYLLLAENIHPQELIAILIIALGVYLTEKRQHPLTIGS